MKSALSYVFNEFLFVCFQYNYIKRKEYNQL